MSELLACLAVGCFNQGMCSLDICGALTQTNCFGTILYCSLPEQVVILQICKRWIGVQDMDWNMRDGLGHM